MRCDSSPSFFSSSSAATTTTPSFDKESSPLEEQGPLLQRRRASQEPPSQHEIAADLVSPTHRRFLQPLDSPWVRPNTPTVSLALGETANAAASVALGSDLLAPLQQLLVEHARRQQQQSSENSASPPLSRGRFFVTQCTTLIAVCFACVILLFYYVFLNTLDLNRLAEALLNVTKLTYPSPPKP